MSSVRRAGSVISIGVGLFWTVWWVQLLVSTDTGDNGYSSGDLHPEADLLGAFVLFVLPCLACLVGGWYSLRGRRGWRWPPILVCLLYALLFAGSDEHSLAWAAIVTSNAIVVLLLLFSRRGFRGKMQT